MASFDHTALTSVLTEAQRLGHLGARPIDEVIEHARSVTAALESVQGRVVDIGSGGGVPGWVIVHDRPDLHVTMVDRRTKRTDFLERARRRHRLSDRVEVLAVDVNEVSDEISAGSRAPFDAAVARGFGPPEATLRSLAAVAAPDGVLVVTEPPTGDRWRSDLLRTLGVERVPGPSQVAIFRRPAH